MDLEKEIETVLSYESTSVVWKNDYLSKEYKAAEAIGRKVKSPLNRKRNCSCINDLFIVLKLLTRNTNKLKSLKMSKELKFQIKEGKMITIHGHLPLTNDNLTNEKAIAILTSHPACISEFDKYPENWKKLTGKKEANVVEVPKVVVDEVKEEEVKQTREEELNALDVTVLRQLAEATAKVKDIKKPHFKTGSKKLVQFILDNESK